MTEPTLTVCPVCGAGVDDLTVTGKRIDGVPIWWITCDKCGHRCYGGTMEEAKKMWRANKPPHAHQNATHGVIDARQWNYTRDRKRIRERLRERGGNHAQILFQEKNQRPGRDSRQTGALLPV